MLRRTARPEFRGQRVLLVGLGLHGGGASTAEWLYRQGAKVVVTDRQPAAVFRPALRQLRRLSMTFHLGGHRPADFRWADRIVVNPGVRATLPEILHAERRQVPIDNEASLFARHFPGTLIGVTGTRGKTTTTLLLGAIVKRSHRNTIVSGNVRQVPMLRYLPRTTAGTIAVLELSSYQLERLPVDGRRFHVAVMTNLKVDHLDRHGTMEQYARIKFRLFSGQGPADRAVLNADDRYSRRVAKLTRGQRWWFGRNVPAADHGITINAGWVVERHAGKMRRLFPQTIWTFRGEHNLANMLAAVAAARSINIPPMIIASAVRSFRGVPYRQQVVRTYHGHAFVDDSAATSPDGTLAALSVFPDGVFIVGGTDKALDMRPLARVLKVKRQPVVFLPGTATEKLQMVLRRMHYAQPFVTARSMSGAVRVALEFASPGQPIVLSPGAASFGLFRHEFDRGDTFNHLVRSWS